MARALSLAVLLLIPSIALADLVAEGSIGRCEITGKTEGTWWQGDYFEVARMKSGCWRLGVSDVMKEMRYIDLGWRAAVVDFGKVALRENAYGGPGSQPHWSADGSGRTFGATIGALAEKNIAGVTAGAEAGLLLYHSAWQATVTHFASGVSVDVAPPATNGFASYVGVTMEYGMFFTTARRYNGLKANPMASNGDQIGPSSFSVVTWDVGLQVEF